MNNIIICESKVQFKNPMVGMATKSIEGHYNGRRIVAEIDGERQTFRFDKDELVFNATEADMIVAIETKLENK